MRASSDSEPYRVSDRFRLTLESSILTLEAGAARDERALSLIQDPDHRRRQQRLIDAQLERAFRLRELLARTVRFAESKRSPVTRY
jgi:hypothetical protein